MELSLLLITLLLGTVQAIPQCESDCSSDTHFCESTCYSDGETTLYTISTKFGSDEIKCFDGSIGCPDDLTGFDFTNCQAQCIETTECTAYIKGADIAGPRCTFLDKCLSMNEAGVLVPCQDCESERSCVNCPSFQYQAGSSMEHWLCEMDGDAYASNPSEGTVCKPTASCVPDKPDEILCDRVREQGIWVNTEDGKPVPDELLEDTPCLCNDLTIISTEDNALICDQPNNDEDGNWVINQTGARCDLICGMSFIPIGCRINETKDGASWFIDGDMKLISEATCLACNHNFNKKEETPRTKQNKHQIQYCAILDF